MTDLVWTALALIARSFVAQAPGETRGTFFVAADTDRAAVELCLNHAQDTGVYVVGGLDAATVGSTINLSFDPRPGWASVAKDMDDLLSEPENRIRAKSRFLVLETKESSDDALDEKTEVGRYRLVVNLVQSLKDVAGFLDTHEQNLVFISGGRFDLPVNFSAADLKQMNADEVRALTTLIPSDTHKKQCAAILATAIVDLLRPQPVASRFAYLLSHAKELRAAYDQGYKMYAAGFSYDKLKDTVEAARVEYVGKIHKVLSDIQNQLLGIPVATIIVATQMKEAKGFKTEFFVNSAVLLGCVVFVALTLLLIWNQLQTLAVLKGEISRQKRQMEKEYAAIAGMLGETFESLDARARTQKVVLGVIFSVVIAGLCMAVWAYAKLTPDAWSSLTGDVAPVSAAGGASSISPPASGSASSTTPAASSIAAGAAPAVPATTQASTAPKTSSQQQSVSQRK
ncbi:MAG: hypothetical protein EKK52_18810 [Burkholderiales bacterium]|uniref:hypothetical protein n=1 Tax=Roseateles sp. TaxID=1971397 RepID=UPI000F971EF0|nr:MAG: hypothetical protein EKK52_18810 [Burkholderiales bacterium]